jgi:hypothetical protein
MQKVFNTLTTISFVGIVTIFGAVGYVYVNKDAIIDDVKAQVMAGVSDVVQDSIVGGFTGGSGTSAIEEPATLLPF